MSRDRAGNKAVLLAPRPSRRQSWRPATYNTHPSSIQEIKSGSRARTGTLMAQSRQEAGVLG